MGRVSRRDCSERPIDAAQGQQDLGGHIYRPARQSAVMTTFRGVTTGFCKLWQRDLGNPAGKDRRSRHVPRRREQVPRPGEDALYDGNVRPTSSRAPRRTRPRRRQHPEGTCTMCWSYTTPAPGRVGPSHARRHDPERRAGCEPGLPEQQGRDHAQPRRYAGDPVIPKRATSPTSVYDLRAPPTARWTTCIRCATSSARTSCR